MVNMNTTYFLRKSSYKQELGYLFILGVHICCKAFCNNPHHLWLPTIHLQDFPFHCWHHTRLLIPNSGNSGLMARDSTNSIGEKTPQLHLHGCVCNINTAAYLNFIQWQENTESRLNQMFAFLTDIPSFSQF